MDRIIINTTQSAHVRFKMENFNFSKKDEREISLELDKLEAMLNKQSQAVFSVSKVEGLFTGSLKIDSHDLYAYSKDSSALSLFKKLRLRVERDILAKARLNKPKYI